MRVNFPKRRLPKPFVNMPPAARLPDVGFIQHQEPPILAAGTEVEPRELPTKIGPRFDIRKLNLVNDGDKEQMDSDADFHEDEIRPPLPPPPPSSVSANPVQRITSDQGPTNDETLLLDVEESFDDLVGVLLDSLAPALAKARDSRSMDESDRSALLRVAEIVDRALLPYCDEIDDLLTKLHGEDLVPSEG